MSSSRLQHIVIVGGGTAGWMTANLLAHRWAESGTKISLVESSDIGIIGVGEGSTPFLRQFFQQLQIPEHEWMPACNATYKCGIRFPGWSSVTDYADYVHPFFNQADLTLGNEFFENACLRRRGHDVDANPQDFFLAAELARQCKAPIYLSQQRSKNYQYVQQPNTPATDYAYHFDAGLLGQFLKSHAQSLGVHHQIDTIAEVKLHENGDISHLQLHSGAVLHADFFIDCSGFRGLLINQALGEPFISYKDNLFNDRAIAIPTALDNRLPIASETTSSALSNGWAWKIPLSSRVGNGYVYASDFISDEQAETELRQHLGSAAEHAEARHLQMRVGRVERHWRNNCLAIGLSQGFIEPLEATALMLIQMSVVNFVSTIEQAQFGRHLQAQYNQGINQMFEGVRDYVVAHYHLNTRNDSEYWRANRNHRHLSDRLTSLLEVWDQGGDFEAELSRHGNALMYLRPSWYCLFAGMGRFPKSVHRNSQTIQSINSAQARNAVAQIAESFYSHNDYLQLIYGQSWKASGDLRSHI